MDFSFRNFPFIRCLLCGLILLSQFDSIAQDTLEVTEIEYFFDVDPGVGSATTITVTPDSLVASVETLGSSGLAVGFHVLGFRAKNFARVDSVSFDGFSSVSTVEYMNPALRSSGQWGFTETRLVYVDPSETGGIVEVDEIEYFFDTDPGVGGGTAINGFASANSISIDEVLSSSSLEFGFHSLGMRVRAVGGSWGMTETRLVFVDQSGSGSAVLVDSLEYFFDVDPGVGSATIIDGFTSSTLLNLDEVLSTSTLELGFHALGVRAKAVGGSWGITETRLIYVDPSSSGGIVNVDQIEYFFDEDPGVGSATLIDSFSPSDLLNLSQTINSSSLSSGFHVLGMRARAEGGSWGTMGSRLVYVDNMGSEQSNIVQFEYFIDDDPGVGNASSASVSTPETNVSEMISVDASALSTGIHTLYVRALNDLDEWGMIEIDSFEIVNIGGPIISSISGDTTNATPINVQVSFEREVVNFQEGDVFVQGNGRVQAGSLVDNGDGTYEISLDSLNDGLIEVFIPSGSANALDDDSPTPESDTLKIIYDATAPVVSINSLTTVEDSPELSGEVDDLESVVEVSIDGNSYTAQVNSDSTWILAGGTISPALADGVYEVELTATDVAGNTGVDATNLELTIDSSPPVVSIDLLTTAVRSPMLTGNVDEMTTILDIEIDGNVYAGTNNDDGTWMLIAGTISPELVDGVYDVKITAIDAIGNEGTDLTTDELTINNVSPIVTITPQTTSIRSPEINGTVDDPEATLDIEVDGNSYSAVNNTDGTWTLAEGLITPDLPDGTYNVIATATKNGNAGVDGTVDELRISSTIVALPATAVTSTTFEANWSTGLDVKEYRVDVSEVSDFSTFVAGYEDFNAGTSTGLFVSNLDFATTYYYKVRLINTNDQIASESNVANQKTEIDNETVADSTALRQIYDATGGSSWDPAVNWETARLRNWDNIALNSTRTRIEDVNISSLGAVGDMPNPFVGDAVGGLSVLLGLDASSNQITRLMDFSGTSITNLNVSGNHLHFDDLEPIVGIASVDYSGQAAVTFNEAEADLITVRYDTDFSLSTAVGGSNNQYLWYRNGVAIISGAAFTDNGDNLEILTIDFDNMGEFNVEVTSSIVTGLTIEVEPQVVLAIADFEVRVLGTNDQPLPETVSGYLLETTRKAKGFDTLARVSNVASVFTFPDVVLGNYLTAVDSDPAKYIPTYSGNEFLWDKADTIFFRNDDGIDISIEVIPPPTNGDGLVTGTIETDFAEDEGRIDARRRAAKRKCGLRRKTGGGRTDADDDGFELIAYGETNDNGEFEYGELPEGTYRFFVEYPGIPLDESSFVEFEVGEEGISENEFKLAATVTEGGIFVELIEELGNINKYFKNLEIYPNPSSEVLNISYRHLTTDAVKVELIDLGGAVLLQEDLQRGYDRELNLDVTSFEDGIYVLRFYDTQSKEKNMMSYRVIVRRD